MYNRLYKFFENNKLIYNLQFGFRQKYSTSHALIQLDSGKYAFGIFVEFQKAFDTVDHAVLIQKLIFYGVHGKTNN